jgi:hypothetical protein
VKRGKFEAGGGNGWVVSGLGGGSDPPVGLRFSSTMGRAHPGGG